MSSQDNIDDFMNNFGGDDGPSSKKKRIPPPEPTCSKIQCVGRSCPLTTHSSSVFFPNEYMEWGYYKPTLNQWAASGFEEPGPIPIGDWCKICYTTVERNFKAPGYGKAGCKRKFEEKPKGWVYTEDNEIRRLKDVDLLDQGAGQATHAEMSASFAEFERFEDFVGVEKNTAPAKKGEVMGSQPENRSHSAAVWPIPEGSDGFAKCALLQSSTKHDKDLNATEVERRKRFHAHFSDLLKMFHALMLRDIGKDQTLKSSCTKLKQSLDQVSKKENWITLPEAEAAWCLINAVGSVKEFRKELEAKSANADSLFSKLAPMWESCHAFHERRDALPGYNDGFSSWMPSTETMAYFPMPDWISKYLGILATQFAISSNVTKLISLLFPGNNRPRNETLGTVADMDEVVATISRSRKTDSMSSSAEQQRLVIMTIGRLSNVRDSDPAAGDINTLGASFQAMTRNLSSAAVANRYCFGNTDTAEGMDAMLAILFPCQVEAERLQSAVLPVVNLGVFTKAVTSFPRGKFLIAKAVAIAEAAKEQTLGKEAGGERAVSSLKSFFASSEGGEAASAGNSLPTAIAIADLGDKGFIESSTGDFLAQIRKVQEWLFNLPADETECLEKGKMWLQRQDATLQPFIQAVCKAMSDYMASGVAAEQINQQEFTAVFDYMQSSFGAPSDATSATHKLLPALKGAVASAQFAYSLVEGELAMEDSSTFAENVKKLGEAFKKDAAHDITKFFPEEFSNGAVARCKDSAAKLVEAVLDDCGKMRAFQGSGGSTLQVIDFSAKDFEDVITTLSHMIDHVKAVSILVDAAQALSTLNSRKEAIEKAHEAFLFKAADKIISDAMAEADRLMEPIDQAVALPDWAAFSEKMSARSAVDNAGIVSMYNHLLKHIKMPGSKAMLEVAGVKVAAVLVAICVVSAHVNMSDAKMSADDSNPSAVVDDFIKKVKIKKLPLHSLPKIVKDRCVELKPSSVELFRAPEVDAA
ncbi:unnamed protein product [Prorocentrum cordatum]|uniref:Uncharacterized protein n=1 Tax=Prorocentrum cordatum TaxID=2364126 RepID=A0ABN9X5G6_9DINO|nr:unnamed protein product [Polarella glacialis]